MHPPIHPLPLARGVVAFEVRYATGSEWIYWFGDVPLARGRSYSFEFTDCKIHGIGVAMDEAKAHYRKAFNLDRVKADKVRHAGFAADVGWTLFSTLARIGHGIADARRAKDLFFDRRRRVSLLNGEKSEEYRHVNQDYTIASNLHNKLEGLMYAAQGIALAVDEAANLRADAERDLDKDQKNGPCECKVPGSCPLCGKEATV